MLEPPSLPEVPGDPAGMRALAGTLRGQASTVGTLAGSVAGDVSSMTFEGPAADELKPRVRDAANTYRDAAHGLQDVARFLDTEAAEVEARQADRARRLANMWNDYRRMLADRGPAQ